MQEDGCVLVDKSLELIAQGAEARVYRGVFLSRPAVVKERFKKVYRHPVLDEKLTKERMTLEGRCMVRACRAGIDVPTLYFVDVPRLRLYMELVPGPTVKAFLLTKPSTEAIVLIARSIGAAVARLHNCGLIHGDLTTSNMILRDLPGSLTRDADEDLHGCPRDASPTSTSVKPLVDSVSSSISYSVVLIDFGLSYVCTRGLAASCEDRSVDLYVLERAVLSLHCDCGETLFEAILASYLAAVADSAAMASRFQQVRLRGRKRLAFG